MTPDLNGSFQQWNLSEMEVKAALGNTFLLCYLQNKRAVCASIFLSSFATANPGELDKEKEFINIERSRAQLQILDELISECVEVVTAVQEEQLERQAQNPQQANF